MQYESGFSRETKPLGDICGRGKERFKKLIHVIMRPREEADVVVQVQKTVCWQNSFLLREGQSLF